MFANEYIVPETCDEETCVINIDDLNGLVIMLKNKPLSNNQDLRKNQEENLERLENLIARFKNRLIQLTAMHEDDILDKDGYVKKTFKKKIIEPIRIRLWEPLGLVEKYGIIHVFDFEVLDKDGNVNEEFIKEILEISPNYKFDKLSEKTKALVEPILTSWNNRL